MGSNHRNAASILKAEKEIIHYYLAFTEKNIALLEMDWESFTLATTLAQHNESSYVTTILSKLMHEKPSVSSYDLSTVQALGLLISIIGTIWFKN